ncbi:hypothetical protein [Thetidibacter halocola]|uniref:Uncharacterized protein n=1 Tax=Thetidibacter halocola TaxID=2827239 RepID=A0A8J8BB23_9RHOB|nr:hypothetical protein [Thetidibacter halocola]MBS0125808.1 hypothetical protein [Thetidibacter halocola]
MQEIWEAFLAHQAGPDFDGNRHVLMDQSDCTFHNTFYEDVRNLGMRLESHYAVRTERSRTAFYCPGDIAFGMSRMYKSIVETKVPFQITVVRSVDEALRFVGIDPERPGARALLGPRSPDGPL